MALVEDLGAAQPAAEPVGEAVAGDGEVMAVQAAHALRVGVGVHPVVEGVDEAAHASLATQHLIGSGDGRRGGGRGVGHGVIDARAAGERLDPDQRPYPARRGAGRFWSSVSGACP